jgi:TPR repeat protein
MLLQFIIAIVLSLVCLAVPAWADFQAGMDANNREDYATALREWRPLAEQGDALAQYNLGVLYRKGRGVPQDDVQARQWYEKAAVQGEAKAQYNLGILYFNGNGVPKDYQQALRWFRRAADQGEVVAQTKIAIMYDDGQGVPHDIVQAHKWCILAALNGDKSAAELRDALAKEMTPAQIPGQRGKSNAHNDTPRQHVHQPPSPTCEIAA